MARLIMPKPDTVDFETKGIESRPDYPPEPVSVSIKEWGKKPKYFSWGHKAGGNNCSKADAARALEVVWKRRQQRHILFQNAKFDVDVANVHFGLPIPAWHDIEDSMFLIYLEDPRLKTFALKPSSEHFLGMPPDEQDAVKAWLLQKDHKEWVESHLGIDPKTGKRETVKPSTVGKFIWYAPGDVVGPYANGDVIRTEKLFAKLWKSIADRGMIEAYDRERRLMPHLLQSERQGVQLDMPSLGKDLKIYEATLEKLDARIRKMCKKPHLNVDSSAELANAMVEAKLADDGLMGYTRGGAIQTNKQAIADGVTNEELRGLLAYRGPLTTCLKTFMRPWHSTGLKSDGLLFTNWNQVKQGDGKNVVGTSTGRLSSTPNFQNIPKEFAELIKLMNLLNGVKEPTKAQVIKAAAKLAKIKTAMGVKTLPQLPAMRGYITPFKNEILIDRDYSQQEVRILAHYEDGPLKETYLANLWMDFHEQTRQMIFQLLNVLYDRKPVKNTNFGIIYGQGAPSLAIKNDMTVEESKGLLKAILDVFPGIKDINDDMKERARNNEPIRTWGGREYYCEEPAYSEKFKRVMTFDYKLINLLIQGSAADATKEATIRWCEAKRPETRFILNIHDQLTNSTPLKLLKPEMKVLTEQMESLEFDIPLLTEGSVSTKNMNSLVDYDKAGKLVYKEAA
jgi:DNA polymerase I-like protein with 3'-5' exonuclease and polymerase domains